MPWITEITSDPDLSPALANFNTTCAANTVPLSLNPAELTEISDAATDFASAFNAVIAAKAALAAAVESKNVQKAASKAVVSKFAKQFRADPTVSDGLLASLQLPPHSTPGSELAPTIPLDLTASSNGDGVTNLKWNRNGNIQGTQFLIERRTSPSGPWSMFDATTKRTFVTISTPGQYVAYRVSAKRNGQTSPSSTPVVLWDTEESVTLSIAA